MNISVLEVKEEWIWNIFRLFPSYSFIAPQDFIFTRVSHSNALTSRELIILDSFGRVSPHSFEWLSFKRFGMSHCFLIHYGPSLTLLCAFERGQNRDGVSPCSWHGLFGSSFSHWRSARPPTCWSQRRSGQTVVVWSSRQQQQTEQRRPSQGCPLLRERTRHCWLELQHP